MKRILLGVIAVLCVSNVAFASWALVPLDDLINDSDLVVIGELHGSTEDSEGIGKGYIRVDHIISPGIQTRQGGKLKPGDNLKIVWADNWACAAGMHQRRVGIEAVWLLKVQDDGTVVAGYPGRFRPLEDLQEINELLSRKSKFRLASVDVVSNNSSEAVAGDQLQHTDFAKSVDISPFDNYSLARASLVAGLAFVLYILLYRSRFRIR